MAPGRNSNVELLAVSAERGDGGEGEYRFLVDGKHVKYVMVVPDVLPQGDCPFTPASIPLLPQFPPGDWNDGYVSKDEATGESVFSRAVRSQLPGIENIWHPTIVDHLELTKTRDLRPNIHLVTHPLFERPVIAKFAQFHWQTPWFEDETIAYGWINGTGIGPKFLGHIAEEGRIIGFLIENIDDSRTATGGDLAICQDALRELHKLGIKHGDVARSNFLVRGGKAIIIDIESAERCGDAAELRTEFDKLESSLSASSP